ncbi:hypothetical protein D3C85_958760 [compost metagenome]
MEDGDLHALAQLLFNVEALGRLDVFQVDAAQRGFQRRDDVDQLVGVVFGQFDVEHVDAGKLLEQAALAFHDRLGGQRTDVAQAQDGGAVGDHAHQVAARGVLGRGVIALLEDGHASCRHAGGIGQGQVVLVGQGLGRDDRDFAGGGIGVVVQRHFGKSFVHGIGASEALTEKENGDEKRMTSGGLAARRFLCEMLREHPYFTRKRGHLVVAVQRSGAFDQERVGLCLCGDGFPVGRMIGARRIVGWV